MGNATLSFSQVLSFDGVDDFVALPAMNFDYSAGFTLEVWARWDGFQDWSRIIDFGNGVGVDNILVANPGGARSIHLSVHATSAQSAELLTTGVWTHVAVVVDAAGTASIYKDGQLVHTGAARPPPSILRTSCYVGRSNWAQGGWFHGQLAELRVWNVARDQAALAAHRFRRLRGDEAGLAFYFPLDEGADAVLLDRSRSRLRGRIHGATWARAELPLAPARPGDGADEHRRLAELTARLAATQAQLIAAQAQLAARGDLAGRADEPLRFAVAGEHAAPPVPAAPGPARVVIGHVNFHGVTRRTQADEYVEVTNLGETPQDLAGWRVSAANNGKDFVFPAATVLGLGDSVWVYTNLAPPGPGRFSFASKRALWNDRGDEALLLDAGGREVARYGYGTRENRTIAGIKAACRVPGLQVVVDPGHLVKQLKHRGKIDFLTALERALRSLLDDPADGPHRTAALAVQAGWKGAPPDPGAATRREVLRRHLETQQLHLLHDEDLPAGAKVVSSWIFQLKPGMGDRHWVIVDRSGARAAVQDIR